MEKQSLIRNLRTKNNLIRSKNLKGNRRGFLLGEHSVGIIIAVLCILVLIVLYYKFYNLYQDGKAMEIAKTRMDEIKGVIDQLVLSGGGEREVVITSPQGWVITAWPNNYIYNPPPTSPNIDPKPISLDGKIPEYCSKNNWEKCLCFCFASRNLLEGCNSASVCIDSSKLEKINIKSVYDLNYLIIDSAKTLVFNYESNENVLNITLKNEEAK